MPDCDSAQASLGEPVPDSGSAQDPPTASAVPAIEQRARIADDTHRGEVLQQGENDRASPLCVFDAIRARCSIAGTALAVDHRVRAAHCHSQALARFKSRALLLSGTGSPQNPKPRAAHCESQALALSFHASHPGVTAHVAFLTKT